MGLIKGGFQRLLQSALYLIILLCNIVILGIFSYFLAVLADRNLFIPKWERAVEGLSGAAVVYLLFATVLTCCLGGVSFFAFLALVLDILFCGAMIAIAVLTRHGANKCTGIVNTPLGKGPAGVDRGFGGGANGNITYEVHLGLACRLETAVFACAIIAAVLFLVTAIMQVVLVRHHRKEKRFGPSPDNNYTSGYGNKKKRGLFSRKKKNNDIVAKDAEAGAAGEYVPNGTTGHADGTTGTNGVGGTQFTSGHANGTPVTHSGYHTAPTGTVASNPYGYNNNTATNY